MKVIKGGITQPKGFKANGLYCGIKRSGALDLGLIVSDVPAASAAVFTKNSVKAAPLLVSQKHIRKGEIQAIIINSGNANCFTGEFGLLYAQKTTQMIAELLKIPSNYVLVASTGIIGRPLPFEKIQHSAPAIVEGLSERGSLKFAKAILTTDLTIKEIAVEVEIGKRKVIIAGCAKGSGMIAPDMATMLGFITTDASISKAMLKLALKRANEETFNSITVDGCMSTNDMVAVMANGLAGNKRIVKEDKDFKDFYAGLQYVCLDLAKRIVLDGEGATKFITIQVKGAKTAKQAKKVGLAIANSDLVKTAAFGENPNWGRVAAAAGSIGIKEINEKNLKIDFSSFKKREIDILVDINLGAEKATVYTCDLSYDYVKINGEYN